MQTFPSRNFNLWIRFQECRALLVQHCEPEHRANAANAFVFKPFIQASINQRLYAGESLERIHKSSFMAWKTFRHSRIFLRQIAVYGYAFILRE
jgi:hypothetical protein